MLLLPDFEAEFWLKHTSSLKQRKRDCPVKKIVLTQKPLTIKKLSLFSIILSYFRFGHHDKNENFINLFLMPLGKCLPSFKTLTLFWTGGGQICPPSWFFEYSSETVRSRKLKLCDF